MLAAAGPDADVADRVDGLLFAGWFEASGGDLDRAVADVREAIAIADTGELRSRARLILAFVHSQSGRPHDALAELAARTGGDAPAQPTRPDRQRRTPPVATTQTGNAARPRPAARAGDAAPADADRR